ncbi:MAG: EAL and HDOD domain-containing protein [Steroidobacteraceae bacterium]
MSLAPQLVSSRLSRLPQDEIHVVRQPIFDRQQRVLAYELIHGVAGEAPSESLSATASAARVVLAAVTEIGLERLVGRATAHFALPLELARDGFSWPLPPDQTVLNLAADIVPDEVGDSALLENLAIWRAEGFRLAARLPIDYALQAHPGIFSLCQMIRLDMTDRNPAEYVDTVRHLREHRTYLIADNLSDIAQFNVCRDMGFRGFHGTFLQQPEAFPTRGSAAPKNSRLEVLAALQSPDYSIGQIVSLVSRDLDLVHRILRILNSSYYSFDVEVTSISHGINLLGRDKLLRLCSMLVLAAYRDRPPWLLGNVLLRARMCESLRRGTEIEIGALFITGMLSHLDALLGEPIATAIRDLKLAEPVRAALLHREGEIGDILSLVEAYESGQWDIVDQSELASPADLREAYLEALAWAEDALSVQAD